jgi:ubiquinone/menaquinone biosynthesis C-methylase UbiE
MVAAAGRRTDDPRVHVLRGRAEQLPWGDHRFDLVVSTTSFDHWHDQGAGIAECARVLAPTGHLVLTDLFSIWCVPTLIGSRRGRVRTRRRIEALLRSAGLATLEWQRPYSVILNTVVASA